MANVSAPGLENYVIKGVEDRITKYFGVSQTAFVSAADRLSRLKVLAQQKDIKFPIAFLVFTDGSVDQTYNARSMRRQGIHTEFNESKTSIGKMYAVPTMMNFSVVLVTDAFENSLRFFKLWMLASTAGSLNFDISYDNIQVNIVVGLAPNLTIPSRDISLETSAFFEMEGTLNVHGYVSPDFIEQTPVLRTVATTATAQDLQ